MTEKTEALRLADALDECKYVDVYRCKQAAAELRRLHAQRDEMLEALKWLDKWMGDKTIPECVWKVRATIARVAKAEGEKT